LGVGSGRSAVAKVVGWMNWNWVRSEAQQGSIDRFRGLPRLWAVWTHTHTRGARKKPRQRVCGGVGSTPDDRCSIKIVMRGCGVGRQQRLHQYYINQRRRPTPRSTDRPSQAAPIHSAARGRRVIRRPQLVDWEARLPHGGGMVWLKEARATRILLLLGFVARVGFVGKSSSGGGPCKTRIIVCTDFFLFSFSLYLLIYFVFIRCIR
jgi:hypothetical protein